MPCAQPHHMKCNKENGIRPPNLSSLPSLHRSLRRLSVMTQLSSLTPSPYGFNRFKLDRRPRHSPAARRTQFPRPDKLNSLPRRHKSIYPPSTLRMACDFTSIEPLLAASFHTSLTRVLRSL